MSAEDLPLRRARITEIAALAGVGTATVDRVLNDRAHVADNTRQRVLQAKRAIETGATEMAKPDPWRLKVFLPGEAGPSTEFLARCFQEFGTRGNATIECVFTRKMEPAVLARKLQACAGQGIDAVAFQALDDPRVHSAVEELARLNVPSAALMSPIENASLIGFVGMNNRAAGRTAGYLMGRLTRITGTVVIMSGGQLYQSHEDREMGFRATLRHEFPHVVEAVMCNGHDDIDENYEALRALLHQRDDIIGVYNVGGGNEGVARALTEADAADEVVYIGHNLTGKTRSYLLNGTMDVVLHINIPDVAAETVEMLIAHLEKRPRSTRTFGTQIITRENILGVPAG